MQLRVSALIVLLTVAFSYQVFPQINQQIYSFSLYNDGLQGVQNIMFNNKLYYISATAYPDPTYEFFQTDGTPQGTTRLSTMSELSFIGSNSDFMLFSTISGYMISTGGALTPLSSQAGSAMAPFYFLNNTSSTTGFLNDLWVTDGTNTGTKNFIPSVFSFTLFKGDLYYIKGVDFRLYRNTNGVENLIGDVQSSYSIGMQFLGSTASQLFINSNSTIWATDGNAVTNIGPSNDNYVYPYQILRGKLYFYSDGDHSMYVTHGVPGDLKSIAQIYSDVDMYGTTSQGIVLFSGYVNCVADTFISHDFQSGQHVIIPDTTTSYFYVFKDSSCSSRLYKYNSSDLSKQWIIDLTGEIKGVWTSGISVNGRAPFLFNDRTHGAEVWTTDGTSDGTGLLIDDITTSTTSPLNAIGWAKGKNEYYFTTYGSYYDLWKLDSASNTVDRLYSFCGVSGPPVVFDHKVYAPDGNSLLQIDPASKAVTQVFNNPDLTFKHLIAGPGVIYYGAQNSDYSEILYASTDGVTFTLIGDYDLDGAYINYDTLYQLTKGADSLYLYRSNVFGAPLSKVKGIDLSSNVYQSSVTGFGANSVLISEQTYNSNQKSFYSDGTGLHTIEVNLGSNGYPHYNDLVVYSDTVFFRVLSITGNDQYYIYVRGQQQPNILFTTPDYSHSNLIGGGNNKLFYLLNNYVLKYDLVNHRSDTLSLISDGPYATITSSFRNGYSLVFFDDSQNIYYINTSKHIAFPLEVFQASAPFMPSPESIYFSTPNALWKVKPVFLITGINESNFREINLYPNPATEKIFFSQTVPFIEIYSMDGKKMMQLTGTDAVNISSLPVGLFIARVRTTDNEVIYKRFIKK